MNKPFNKDTPIIDLDVEQLTQLFISATETKGYIAAQNEQEVTKRIFADADGIISAGVVPFRAGSVEDLKRFFDELSRYFRSGGKGKFVIAAALLSDGEYTKEY